MIYRTTPAGVLTEGHAVAELSADEARLVDVVIRLHDLVHRSDAGLAGVRRPSKRAQAVATRLSRNRKRKSR